jgi:hypothetical protein
MHYEIRLLFLSIFAAQLSKVDILKKKVVLVRVEFEFIDVFWKSGYHFGILGCLEVEVMIGVELYHSASFLVINAYQDVKVTHATHFYGLK